MGDLKESRRAVKNKGLEPSPPSNDPEGGGKAVSRSHACQNAHAQSCSPAAERQESTSSPSRNSSAIPTPVLGAGKRGSYSQIGNEVQDE